jgi:putative ABC transport system permease protein
MLAGQLLTSLLFGLKPTDPLTVAASSLIFILAALAASYVPVHRASRVDPARTLRLE